MRQKYTPSHYLLAALFILMFYTGKDFVNQAVAQTLPRPDHIIILIEENQPNSLVMGRSSVAPYINQLAADTNAVLFTKLYAIEHPSQGNYFDLFAGSNQGVLDDNLPANYPFNSPNMARALLDRGLTFATYSQDLPSVGFDGVSSSVGSYARKHNPVTNWVGTGTYQVPDTLNQPLEALPTDFTQLPTVSYIVPNEDSDMHNGTYPSTVTAGDFWMQEHLSGLIDWCRTHNSLFIYTYDEDDGFFGNNIPTLFYGPMVKGGSCTTTYDLFSMLRTIEDMYGLRHSGAANTATPITDVWKAQPAPSGIQTINTSVGLKVSPNPVSTFLMIDGTALPDGSGEVIITDIAGRTISQHTLPASKKLEVNTTEYPAGLYFYHLSQDSHAAQTGKFVVAH